MSTPATRFKHWLFSERHARLFRQWRQDAARAFTNHPHETDETYLEHLWFTFRMALRFIVVTLVMLVHGLFPFLLTRTASAQIEKLYGTMKGRIPRSRRQELDAAFDDYSV